MSIGYSNAISGNFSMQSKFNGPVGPLGGGIKGFMPQQTNDSDNSNYFAQNRFTLREAWNTNYKSILQASGGKRIITPFRAVNNAGDLLSRENYSCGGSCQTFQSRPGLNGLKTRFGAIQSVCDKTNVPPSACNVKYVYDSSDYIKFKRQSASVKNYNDLSNGGDRNNASQSSYRAIRRY